VAPGTRTFADLVVWRRAVDLVVVLYELTSRFPRAESFGLTAQVRRAAVSIPANIAEGNSRYSTASYVNHINVALGSHGELRALVEISTRLGYINSQEAADVRTTLDELGRMLSGLRRALLRRMNHPDSTSAP
jgi:four helix bundle protein